jgi:hypothetical protein
LLLPVLAMATTQIPTGISRELPFRLKVSDAQFDLLRSEPRLQNFVATNRFAQPKFWTELLLLTADPLDADAAGAGWVL